MGTKSSVDRKRSKYGERFSLRFHKPLRTYELSCSDCHPMLLAKFTEVDGDLAIHCWETFEKLYQENKELQEKQETKQKHIVLLEEKIHRMRDSITRLEILYHYRDQEGSVDLKKECFYLKQENARLKWENNKLKKLKQNTNHEDKTIDCNNYNYKNEEEPCEILLGLNEYQKIVNNSFKKEIIQQRYWDKYSEDTKYSHTATILKKVQKEIKKQWKGV